MRRGILLIAVIVMSACTQTPSPIHPGGPGVCRDGPRAPSAAVDRDVAVTGTSVQSMRRDRDEIFLVESGDNTVSRFDVATQSFDVLVDVGNGRGPWDVAVGEDELWITNFLANTVTVADRHTGELLEELAHDSLQGPAGIALLDRRVYVSNTQFRGDGQWGPGSVTVIDQDTRRVYGAAPTQQQNPQSLAAIGDKLVVVSAGTFAHDGTKFVVGSEAAVEVWSPTGDPLLPERSVRVLPLADDRSIGVPGHPAHHNDSSIIYLPSATAPVVFAFDLETTTWTRGADDPIRLYETDDNALHHAAMGDDGVLYVTAFNEDALYLVDTSCDRVLDRVQLERSSMLAGPHGVVPIGDEVYFVLAHANELGRVTFDFGDDDE